jgi:HD domain/Amino acid permease
MVEEQYISSVAEKSIYTSGVSAGSQISTQQKLPAVLGTKDMVVFLLLIMLFISNVNGVQFGGPVTFLYWGLGVLTFLIPSAYATRWLALRFPGQGAPFTWASRVLGLRWSTVTTFCAWWPGVFSVVFAVKASLTFIQYLNPAWFTTPTEQGIAMVAIIIVAIAIACLPLRFLKNTLLALAALYLSIFALIGAAGAWWLWSGHAIAKSFTTSGAWQLNGGNSGIYSVVVLAHHERWDGTGYPMKLAGEAIPLHARILTVVDSFDAMTSRRVYREPMSIEAARIELQRCSGSQFDPCVLEVFLQVLDESTEDDHVGTRFTASPEKEMAYGL